MLDAGCARLGLLPARGSREMRTPVGGQWGPENVSIYVEKFFGLQGKIQWHRGEKGSHGALVWRRRGGRALDEGRGSDQGVGRAGRCWVPPGTMGRISVWGFCQPRRPRVFVGGDSGPRGPLPVPPTCQPPALAAGGGPGPGPHMLLEAQPKPPQANLGLSCGLVRSAQQGGSLSFTKTARVWFPASLIIGGSS